MSSLPPTHLLPSFSNHTATTYIYTLSLHERSSDLLVPGGEGLPLPDRVQDGDPGRTQPIGDTAVLARERDRRVGLADVHVIAGVLAGIGGFPRDRKSTRLNSSHVAISYAVFCLKKKKKK